MPGSLRALLFLSFAARAKAQDDADPGAGVVVAVVLSCLLVVSVFLYVFYRAGGAQTPPGGAGGAGDAAGREDQEELEDREQTQNGIEVAATSAAALPMLGLRP